MSRIFSVRLNVDDAFASLDQCPTSDDKLAWLDGLRLGLRGGSMPASSSPGFALGYSIGAESYRGAVAFREAQSAKSNKRWHAGDMPRDMPRDSRGISPEVSPEVSPEHPISNNRIIEESRERLNGEPPASPPAPPPSVDSIMEDMESSAKHVQRMSCGKNFADWRAEVGHRIFWNREEDELWKAIFNAEGWDEMTRGYRFLAQKHPAPKKIFISMIQELRT